MDATLKEFANFGMDYLLSLFDNDNVKQEPRAKLDFYIFRPKIFDDVLVTQTLMRWYYRQLFHFTFVKEHFQDEVILYWRVWIQNRTTIYEKITDSFAIIMEAKLYCDIYKSTPLSLDDCKQLLFKCFEYLKDDWDFFGDWDKFYSDAPEYPCSIMNEDCNIINLGKNELYDQFNDTCFNTLKQSGVKFPIPVNRINLEFTDRIEPTKYVFVRFPSEMGRCLVQKYNADIPPFLTEIDIVDGNIVCNYVPGININYRVMFTFLPQDRLFVNSTTEYNESSPIRDEEENYDEEKMMDWKQIFCHAVLKIKHYVDIIVLISPRYNNFIENMLSKRYSGRPGRFFGDSNEFDVSYHHTFNATIGGLPNYTVGINWIDAVLFTHEFFFLN